MALPNFSVSIDPFDVLSDIIRLAAFTPSSALPLDWGYSAEDKRWWTPQLYRKA